MKHICTKILVFIFSLILVDPLWAADNAVVVTVGSGLTLRSRDVGAGVQSLQQILGDTSGNAIYGTAGTANSNVLTIQGIASGTTVPITGTLTAVTAITNALPAGTNVIGHVIVDTTSTTAVTQATGTNLHAVIDTGSTTAVTQATGTNLHSVVDSGTITTVSTVTNLAQMNGAALLMGNGVTGTGSQRVTIASDNTAFSVNATLSAETTKVIGTVRNLGNAGAITDFVGQAATAPANAWLVGATFFTTPTTLTNGQASPLQLDNAGNLLVNIKAGAGSGGTALADEATFTQGTTSLTPVGCTFNNSITNLTSGQAGVFSCTAARSLHTTVDNANANGSATSANSSPVVIASDQVAVAVKAASGTIASGAIASGAVASGAISSGAFASGSIGSGAVASGAVASGAYASGSLSSGAVVDITNMSVTTGSAPPSKALYVGANASGATGGQVAGLITCDKHVFKHITSATDTLAVQGVASQTIRICGWRSRAAGVATWFLENTASANANCSSSNTQITGVATEAANTGETMLAAYWTGLANTSGNGLCINSTGTGGVDIDVWYNQF